MLEIRRAGVVLLLERLVKPSGMSAWHGILDSVNRTLDGRKARGFRHLLRYVEVNALICLVFANI